MGKTMTDKERYLVTELSKLIKELSNTDVEHLFWLAQGIHYASASHGESKS